MNRENMIQTLRRAIPVFLILMLAITTTANPPTIMSAQSVNTNSIPPLLYTSMCCIQDTYWVDWYTNEYWFQIPISVTVWDKKLNPIKNVNVRVKIYDSADVLKFDQSKKTGNNGIAKFGYSQPYDTIESDSDNNRVEVWTGDTYMEKRFSIKVD
ncbi:MAG: hypothetical protein C3F06_02545 [Candidatus Methanoperedenaceae archaeon]|nr:MAG: hypothetical protein C3F06_02545 [Candidatus Methanoperedenaceae archaeon]